MPINDYIKQLKNHVQDNYNNQNEIRINRTLNSIEETMSGLVKDYHNLLTEDRDANTKNSDCLNM